MADKILLEFTEEEVMEIISSIVNAPVDGYGNISRNRNIYTLPYRKLLNKLQEKFNTGNLAGLSEAINNLQQELNNHKQSEELKFEELNSKIVGTAGSFVISRNESTFEYIFTLIDRNGEALSSEVIDLPLEETVIGGSYDPINKRVILTLKNGNEVAFGIADLVSGLINESEKGQAGGVATLDGSGKVPKTQLPNDIGGGIDESVLAEYQKKEDDTLQTSSKSIVGAINEVNAKALMGGGGEGGIDPSILENYLPKTGGELTGGLTVRNPNIEGKYTQVKNDGFLAATRGGTKTAYYSSTSIVLEDYPLQAFNLNFPTLIKNETIATESYVKDKALTQYETGMYENNGTYIVGDDEDAVSISKNMVRVYSNDSAYTADYKSNHIAIIVPGKNAYLSFPTDKTGNQTFAMLSDLEGLSSGGGSGESADLSNYVQFSDIKTSGGLTVNASTKQISVYTFQNYGIQTGGSGLLMTVRAQNTDIDAKSSSYLPIVPYNLDYSVMKGLTAPLNHTWTTDERKAACETIGAVQTSTASGPLVYGRSGGKEVTYEISNSAGNFKIAQYGPNGVFTVATPTADNHAATKKYVDDAIGTALKGDY